MKTAFLFFVVVWVVLFNHGFAEEAKIVNGSPSRFFHLPYLISVEVLGFHECAGALISVNRVLTAAHCTIDTPAGQISVRAGSSFRERGGQLVPVLRYCNHPSFNSLIDTNDNDISVLILMHDISLTYGVNTISISSDFKGVQVGDWATVSGWGRTSLQSHEATQVQVAQFRILSFHHCLQVYGSELFTRDMICAGNGNKSLCRGDGGDPLVLKDTLLGIAIREITCGLDRPAVFLDVRRFQDFVGSCQ